MMGGSNCHTERNRVRFQRFLQVVGYTEIRLKEMEKIYSYIINIFAFRGSESKLQVQRKARQ